LVGGEFVGQRDHIVARLPGIAFRDQVHPLGRIADQGDFGRVGMDHFRQVGAELLDLIPPGRPGDVAAPRGLLRPIDDRPPRWPRQRRHRGMVEIRPALRHRHLPAQRFPVGLRINQRTLVSDTFQS